MDEMPISDRGGAICRRAHERMAESDIDPDLEKARRRGGARRRGDETEPIGGPPQQRRVTDRLCSRGQQQEPTLIRQSLELPREAHLDAVRQRHQVG